jgi:2-polyprenyl-3-methyl-5-hydroxy-6-metoxy-1,4-benzoquinol methylase
MQGLEGRATMNADQDRFALERAKWDSHAGAMHTKGLKVYPPEADFGWLCRKDPLLQGVDSFLGDLRGKQVLEYGCGLGSLTLLLARSGAFVTALDLSEASIEVARARVHQAGVDDHVSFVLSAGEALPFEDGSFDVAVGKAVLHHLEPVSGAQELVRVLRPGGRGAFSEPLGTNPFVNFVRDHIRYPGKHERGADIPLRHSDIETWLEPFAQSRIDGVQLLSMIQRGFGLRIRFATLRRFDVALLHRLPSLWPLCRYGVLTMVKSSDRGSAR